MCQKRVQLANNWDNEITEMIVQSLKSCNSDSETIPGSNTESNPHSSTVTVQNPYDVDVRYQCIYNYIGTMLSKLNGYSKCLK